MRNAWIFYRKEMIEAMRSYKLVWIPVVFILLGIMQPLVTNYMPEILKASGDIPPEMLSVFTIPKASEVMVQALGQYSTIGMLVLALGTMNTLAAERYSGTAEMMLVRPLSPAAMVLAKWAAHLTVLVLAVGLGAAGAGYYTEQLIGSLEWNAVMTAAALYGLWLLCAVSLTLLFSAFLKAPAAAFLGLLSVAALSLGHSLLPAWFRWSPAALPGMSGVILTEGGRVEMFPCLSAAGLIVICIIGAAWFTSGHKLANDGH